MAKELGEQIATLTRERDEMVSAEDYVAVSRDLDEARAEVERETHAAIGWERLADYLRAELAEAEEMRDAHMHAAQTAVVAGEKDRTRADAAEARVGELSTWIVARGASVDKDHACAECVPDGPLIVEGFRCVYHAARVALDAHSQLEVTEED